MKGFKILEAIVVFLLLFYIVYLGHRIAEHQKFTICKSCEEQNWSGELPAVDMKVNCSEVRDWCEEVMKNNPSQLRSSIFMCKNKLI